MIGGFVGFVFLYALFKHAKKKWKEHRLNVKTASALSQYISVVGRVLPSLMGDIRVFIGVYQTLTNMGPTLL